MKFEEISPDLRVYTHVIGGDSGADCLPRSSHRNSS